MNWFLQTELLRKSALLKRYKHYELERIAA